jgi:hypothetical protein
VPARFARYDSASRLLELLATETIVQRTSST